MTEGIDTLRDALDRALRLIRAAELEVVMNPGDVTDEIREQVAAIPLTTLRTSTLIEPGKAYVMRPGAVEALHGKS